MLYSPQRKGLLASIELICQFQRQNPRDKVYGALSFLRSIGRITVDYVFFDTMRPITRESFRQFDHVGGKPDNIQ
jgi:hypothetical protein